MTAAARDGERLRASGDDRPSDRAGPTALIFGDGWRPRRVGLLSVHTSPLAQPGVGDSGGMNVYIASLARQLAISGIEVDIFTRAADPGAPPTVRTTDGVRVHHLEAGPAKLSKSALASHLCAFYLRLVAHPAFRSLELLHGHYWMSGWVGRKASSRLGIPLVQTFHTLARVKNDALAPGDLPEPPLRLAAEDRVVADADAVIAPTPHEAGVLRDRYGARPGAVHVVEPGVDLEIFRAGRRERVSPGYHPGRTILFVGRLQPLKGPDIAVRTLAEIDRLAPQGGPPARLLICGGPSGERGGVASPEGLRALARSLGLDGRVELLGPRTQRQLSALYRESDAVVMPSRSESFGLVALEAQACGTPVVAAAVGGLPYVIRGGGSLVEGHDPADYARALVPYLVDARARAAAARAGREWAAAHSWRRTTDKMLAVYRRAAGQRAEWLSAERAGAC